MRYLSSRPTAIALLTCALLPSAVQAQIKIPKSINQAAAAAGAPTTSAGSARYVKKIDMTSAQLAQVNKGLDVAVKQGPEIIKRWEKAQEAYDKAYGDYTKKKEKYDACIESEKAKAQGKLEAAGKKTDAAADQAGKIDENAMVAQAQAAQAAAERVKNGTATAADRQTLADFQKTMAGVQGNSNAAMAAIQENSALKQAVADSIKKKCGDEPQPPSMGGAAASSSAGKAGGGAAPTSASEEINQASAAAAGMSEGEYRLAREKAKGYALSNTQVQGGSDTPDDEAKAINQALAQTRALVDQANKANVPLM